MVGGKLGNALQPAEETGQIYTQQHEQTSKNNAEQKEPDKEPATISVIYRPTQTIDFSKLQIYTNSQAISGMAYKLG